MNYYRVYLKGLTVGVSVRAERMEVNATHLWFWTDCHLTASLWREDVVEVLDINRVKLPLVAAAQGVA